MLKRILKTSLRNLSAKKGFSLLNIGGLVLGLTCFILIGLYVQDELSYDRHHEKADQIHRMRLQIFLDGTESNFATVAAPVAAGLVENFSDHGFDPFVAGRISSPPLRRQGIQRRKVRQTPSLV